jgi:uncharacterized protein YciI
MSRQVQVGDLVIVRVGHQVFELPITQITENGIHIGDSLLIPPYWKVKGLNEEHEVEFISHQGLSSIEEVNQEILLNLDYNSIISLCSTNKEYNRLCSQDYFWRRMVERDFNEVIQFKPVNITYKEMYKNLYYLKDAYVIEKGDLYLIAWYHLKIRSLNKINANLAARNGHLEVLSWLEQRGILADQIGADMAAENGQLEVLKWLEQKDIFPDKNGANMAAYNGHLKVLIWLEQRNIHPDNEGAELAAENGHLEVLKWLEQKGILPNQRGANWAAANGHLEVLFWLEQRGILPNQWGANNAANNRQLEVLKCLAERNIYPN